MPQRETIKLELCDKEPLMKFVSKRFTPVSLGIYFFLLISLPLCILALIFEPGFFANISWSISIVFLFPFLAGLGFSYYEEVPKLFDHLFKAIVKDATDETEASFYQWLDQQFNNYAATILILITALSISLVFFYQQQGECATDGRGWMFGGNRLYLWPTIMDGCGFTGVGLIAGVLQFVFGYWFISLAYRAAVCYWGLYALFDNNNEWHFQFKVSPLHPDRCCGLGRIGDLAMRFNVIMFIVGLYVSLTVIDKILIQESAAFGDITVPLYLGGYILMAPLLFFLPLGAARRRMKQAKIDFLHPISEKCEQLAKQSGAKLDKESASAAVAFFEMDKLRLQVEREIPVWPFDFRSFVKFSGAIVFPVIPVIGTLLADLGKRLLSL